MLGTIQVIAENYLAKGVFGQTDKTNKICSKTSGGLQISVPPGKEGNHCFYWFPKKKFSIPANTPIKVAAWIKTQNVIGVKNKKLQLGGRLTLSNQSKRYYMWMPGLRTENWKYVEKIA